LIFDISYIYERAKVRSYLLPPLFVLLVGIAHVALLKSTEGKVKFSQLKLALVRLASAYYQDWTDIELCCASGSWCSL
jgi:hypothetical protein